MAAQAKNIESSMILMDTLPKSSETVPMVFIFLVVPTFEMNKYFFFLCSVQIR